jgi:hypothetical protein
LDFQVHELNAFLKALEGINIVQQDEGELLSFGPARPAFRRFGGVRIYRPDIGGALSFMPRDHPPHEDLQLAWHPGLYEIIGIKELHGLVPAKIERYGFESPIDSIPGLFRIF